jgi:hypothetical protein
MKNYFWMKYANTVSKFFLIDQISIASKCFPRSVKRHEK